jgi:hypothetical protein
VPVTYNDLLGPLRQRLDETTAAFWTDAELMKLLYEGAKDVARKSECLRTSATISAVAGTQSYTMATDIIRVHRVEHYNTGQSGSNVRRLLYVDRDSMDAFWWNQQNTSGDPQVFTMWGYPPSLSLVVYPVPVSAGTFTVYYYKLPTSPGDFSNDTTTKAANIDLPAGWEELATDFATYRALMKDRDDRWQAYKQFYDENLASIIETDARFTDQMGMITTPSGSGVPRWLYDEGWVG